MSKKTNVLDESDSLITEIESSLEKNLAKRREEIERELEARIRQEKEESERRLSAVESEIAREKEMLQEYRGAISAFEVESANLKSDIKSLLKRSLGEQKDVEQLTTLSQNELRLLSKMTARLAELREQAEVKVSEIRVRLKDKYGLVVEPPGAGEAGDVVVNLQQELFKLKKIQELLETDTPPVETIPPAVLGNAVPETQPEAESFSRLETSFIPPEMSVPESISPEPATDQFRMPAISQFIEEFVHKESEPPADEPLSELPLPKWEAGEPPAPTQPAEEVNFEAVYEMLEKTRLSEPTDYNGEISFFRNGGTTILDGDSVIRAMSHLVDDARRIYQKLTGTESPKDQFFLKQDLINHQEILRKIILRGVKLCEKEDSRLPRYTDEVVSVRVLKEILDKLNLDNWSNEEEFSAFEGLTLKMKDAFYKRITPPAPYLKSIVKELGL